MSIYIPSDLLWFFSHVYVYIYEYIYIYIYMIEICGKLDKSNTKRRFKCVIFPSGFILYSVTSSRLRLFFLSFKHFRFFPSHPNQTHTLQNNLKTTRICSHLKNKPYKQHPGFYQISPHLVMVRSYWMKTKSKLKMDRKKQTNPKHVFTLCHHTFEDPFCFSRSFTFQPFLTPITTQTPKYR